MHFEPIDFAVPSEALVSKPCVTLTLCCCVVALNHGYYMKQCGVGDAFECANSRK